MNHEVFGTNKYTQQTIDKIRTSLPDTADAFDQMPTRQEVNDAITDTWNSGEYILEFFLYILRSNKI